MLMAGRNHECLLSYCGGICCSWYTCWQCRGVEGRQGYRCDWHRPVPLCTPSHCFPRVFVSFWFSSSDVYAWAAATFTFHLASQQGQSSLCSLIILKTLGTIRPLLAGYQHQAFSAVIRYLLPDNPIMPCRASASAGL